MHSISGRFNHNCFKAAIVTLPLIVTGCSFSDSSGSISDSTSSIISSPSSISDKDKKYQNEVSDYTMAYVKSTHTEADYNSFLKGLSDIAARIGINNWEQEPKTYVAIGKGLKKAGIEGVAYETYKRNFAGSDEEKMQNIQKGYESEK
ncbi:MAG: putative lipoprotein [Gammaproteobacteria bacterium]